MKLERPPYIERMNTEEYLEFRYGEKRETIEKYLKDTDKRYFYWNELKYRPNSPFEDAEKNWSLVKTYRYLTSKRVYFYGESFSYNLTSPIQKDLHEFDLKLVGGLYKNPITKGDQDEFLRISLIEEAISSSQIEGAATTTDIARDMIKSGRDPRNESEQMIINNFKAIQLIQERLNEKLNDSLILEIHELMASDTNADKYSGKFRKTPVYVKDVLTGEVAHEAPKSEEINSLLESLYDFINNEEDFIHPIVKASVLHFMIGYIHPFGDGNGRTARALFYWYLMKKGYSLMKHLSISKAILNSRTSYDKAFLKTEYDDNDLTYFIMYSIKSLRVAFESLIVYRDKKRAEQVKITTLVFELIEKGFSRRQADILGYLSMKKNKFITISEYAEKNAIVRQTATKDLNELIKKGLLNKSKDGKQTYFQLAKKIDVEMF